jgi:hypothetical protein
MSDLASVVRQPPREIMARLAFFAQKHNRPQLQMKHVAGGRSNGFAPADPGNSFWFESLLRQRNGGHDHQQL